MDKPTVLPAVPSRAAATMPAAATAVRTLSQVGHEAVGSAAGLFHTAMQLGTTLGIATASVAFFNHAPAGSHDTTMTHASPAASGMSSPPSRCCERLMFRLPKPVGAA